MKLLNIKMEIGFPIFLMIYLFYFVLFILFCWVYNKNPVLCFRVHSDE